MSDQTLPILKEKLAIDPTDPEVVWILSKTCLTCAPMAHIFQRAGYPIPRHAEEEQAHILLWMLGMYQKHGMEWRGYADNQLRDLVRADEEKRKAVQAEEPAGQQVT